MYYSVCPKCKSRKNFPDCKPYVCKNCHEIVNDTVNSFSTNVETLKPIFKSRMYLFLVALILGILSIFWSTNMDLNYSASRGLYAAVLVPPILLVELILMSKYNVVIWHHIIIYHAIRPKLFNFVKWLYLITAIIILFLVTMPLTINT